MFQELKTDYLLYVGSVLCLVAQSCRTLCDPIDSSPPGSSVYGILQARILEWVAMSFSRGLFPGIEPRTPALQADSLPTELQGKPNTEEWYLLNQFLLILWAFCNWPASSSLSSSFATARTHFVSFLPCLGNAHPHKIRMQSKSLFKTKTETLTGLNAAPSFCWDTVTEAPVGRWGFHLYSLARSPLCNIRGDHPRSSHEVPLLPQVAAEAEWRPGPPAALRSIETECPSPDRAGSWETCKIKRSE